MSVKYVGSYNLGEINVMLGAEVLPLLLALDPLFVDLNAMFEALLLALDKLLAQLDFVLTAEFGLAGLKIALSLQLNAALSISANLGLAIGAPVLYYKGVITSMLSIIVQLNAALAFGLPTVSASLSAEIAANLGLAAVIKAQLLGIQALIDASLLIKGPILALKTPSIDLQAQLGVFLPQIQTLSALLQAALSASGGIHLYLLDGPAITVAGELQAAFAANLGGVSAFAANGNIKAPLIAVDVQFNAAAFTALSQLIKVTDPGEVSFP